MVNVNPSTRSKQEKGQEATSEEETWEEDSSKREKSEKKIQQIKGKPTALLGATIVRELGGGNWKMDTA